MGINEIRLLPSHRCLAVASVAPKVRVEPALPVKHNRFRWLVWINLVVLTGAVVAIAFGLVKRGGLRCWTILAAFAGATLQGCSDSTSAFEMAPNPTLSCPLEISPSRIDFGFVAAIGHDLKAAIELTNRNREGAIEVAFSGGCGCTSFAETDVLVEAGGRVVVPISISTVGRHGDFLSEISVTWKMSDGSDLVGEFAIPVVAHFSQRVYSQPSRALLLSSGENSQVAVITIFAPEDHLSRFLVLPTNSNFIVNPLPTEGSRKLSGQRRFQVIAERNADLAQAAVVVKATDQSEPVLSVPVISGEVTGIVVDKVDVDGPR